MKILLVYEGTDKDEYIRLIECDKIELIEQKGYFDLLRIHNVTSDKACPRHSKTGASYLDKFIKTGGYVYFDGKNQFLLKDTIE